MQTADSNAPLSTRLDLAAWPAADRRSPSLGDRNYLTLSALAEGIREAVTEAFPRRQNLHVLDIGCGDKPYLPLVADRAVSYRGIDMDEGPLVDDVGPAESLPYADGSFDLVLCTQVIEHVFDPGAVVREIHRVLAPQGLGLVSTHGVHVFHPDPPGSGQDFWRWTHAGLERLFRSAGDWRSLQVEPNRNMIACLATLSAWYLDGILRTLGPLRRIAMAAVNSLAAFLDKRFPKTLRVPESGSLAANYLVVARKAGP